MEARFGSLPGVIHTRVGYAGGTTPNPTYHNLIDHTETVQVDFDPTQISYEELLQVFWQSHAPDQPVWSRQYKAAVFYQNEAQKMAALKSRDQVAARLHGSIYTEVLPAGRFYLAEAYHQKYFLRQVPALLAEYTAIYPEVKDLVNSTAAARVNGLLAGYGDVDRLKAELDSLGLSPQGRRLLLGLVKSNAPAAPGLGCPVPRSSSGKNQGCARGGSS